MKSLRDEDVLERALGGHQAAQEELVERLVKTVQYRAGRLLWAIGSGPEHRSSVEDLTQEILLYLFRDGAKVLRSWNRERGSLKTYVGMIADRRGRSMLRGRRLFSPKEQPTEDTKLERTSSEADPEFRAATREELELVLDRLQKGVTDETWRIFELLIVKELSIQKVCQMTGLGRELIYQRKSRLMKKARELLQGLK